MRRWNWPSASKPGTRLALEKLTKANLRFVVSVAKQYQNQGLTLPDLINEGKPGPDQRPHSVLTKPGDLNLSLTPFGGSVNPYLQALAEQSRIVRLPLEQNWLDQ